MLAQSKLACYAAEIHIRRRGFEPPDRVLKRRRQPASLLLKVAKPFEDMASQPAMATFITRNGRFIDALGVVHSPDIPKQSTEMCIWRSRTGIARNRFPQHSLGFCVPPDLTEDPRLVFGYSRVIRVDSPAALEGRQCLSNEPDTGVNEPDVRV